MNRYKLKDLSLNKLEYGSGAAACEYDGSTRYVRITDIDNEGNLGADVVSPNSVDDKYLLNDGDVLFARTGATVGKTYLYRASAGRCIYAGFLIRVVPNQELIRSDYLYFFTKSPQYKDFVQSSMKVVAQPNINAKQYGDLEFNVPSLSEQDSIIAKLRSVSTVIALRKTELLKLDELIKARFVELFGDVKTNCYNWERCTFDDVTTRITDGEHGTVPRVEEGEGYLYFMARNITKDGLIDLSETSYVPEDVHQKIYRRCNPEIDDILLVCVGATIGKSTLVTKELGEFSMARSVALLKPDTQKVNSIFLINLLKSDAIQNVISNCAHAAAQAGLYTNMIKALDAFLPPLELQNQFSDFVKQVDKSKVIVQRSLDETQLLFDSLMQQYFG